MNRQNYRGSVQPQPTQPENHIVFTPLHVAISILVIILLCYVFVKFIRWFWKSEEIIQVIKEMKKESEETTKIVDNIAG